MRYIELLCPAKDYETGIAAIKHGADAIYIGADRFGAREDAGNSISDIERLIKYAHPFNIKVYVTVNTIIYDSEVERVKSLIESLNTIGVDAIIIQDMSILEMGLPAIPIFASTQTHNDSVEKVKFLESVGFERVILARELSLEEVKNIRSQTSIDLEFFVHGALCVCYSGQCYFSQSITGRSANRGACAQPCRSSYDLVDSAGKVIVKNKHLLSLKDLNLSNHLAEMIESGITSFKIEGRLKDISYVKNITSHYSQLLNKTIENNTNLKRSSSGNCEILFTPDPERSFSRGFTSHFVNGRQKEQSSMNTQKSVGKRLGIVSGFGNNWFSIKGKTPLANGDGLCFINSKGVLTGLRVNRVEGDRVYPYGEMNEIKVGLEVFRNFDQEFSNALKGSNRSRWLGCSIKVEQSDSQFVFVASDEDDNSVALAVDDTFDAALNVDKAEENFKIQLSKSGDTIFRILRVDVRMDHPVFIPTSTINQIRRDLLELLIKKRVERFSISNTKRESVTSQYFENTINYKGNIANSLSQAFYKKQGVTKFDEAYELQQISDVELMVTRYCIKYEMGICPVKQNGKPVGEVYLRDNSSLYPLEFDCKNCLMKVKSPKN